MRLTTGQAVFGSVVFLLSKAALSSLAHQRAHDHVRRHLHSHRHVDLFEASRVSKRSTCRLPDDPDLVYIPGERNGGFAMTHDQSCEDGSFCPFACKPGKVMAQWDPAAKTYTYPDSMRGGVKCRNGKLEKPFAGRGYCMDGTGTVSVKNECSGVVSFCQTVLPGNENMLIPTEVRGGQTVEISVPGTDYWAGTAAHYYINAPGTPASEGCFWGSESKAMGNWAAYVAGANTDALGNTFVKIAWNPTYTGCGLSTLKPSYGVEVDCPNGGCIGLPCRIDPTQGVDMVDSRLASTGVGDATFCVVTAEKGKKVQIRVFSTDGHSAEGPRPAKEPASAKKSEGPNKPATAEKPKSSSEQAKSSSPETVKASSEKATPTIPLAMQHNLIAPSSSSASASSSAFSKTLSSTTVSSASTSSSSHPVLSLTADYVDGKGVLHGNATTNCTIEPDKKSNNSAPNTTPAAVRGSSSNGPPTPSETTTRNECAGKQDGTAVAGLIVALVAAAALY